MRLDLIIALNYESLMLSCRNYSSEPDYIKYYGQELMPSTYNLARMNMFLHGVLPENQHLRNGDTLDADWPNDEQTEFDAVTMNPPYSANWSAAEGFKQDERCLHSYTIKEAIHDEAVLGFMVENLGPKKADVDQSVFDTETHMRQVLNVILNQSSSKFGMSNPKGKSYEAILTV